MNDSNHRQLLSPHHLIIGGGVIGLSVAWELANRGLRVSVLDQGAIGQGTSWAAGGILPPNQFDTAVDPLDRLRGFSHRRIAPWCDRLQKVTGIDCGYRRCGGYYLADTPGEKAAMIGTADYWDEMQIECQSISPDELASRQPALSDWCTRHPDAGVWFAPGEEQIRPPRLLKALRSACESSGVELREFCAVDQIDPETGNVHLADDETITADKVIVCNGAWAGRLLPDQRLRNSVVPVRGQIVLMRTPQPLLSSVINIGHRYLLCRDDGRTLVGSCEEEVGFDLSTTDRAIDQLKQFAYNLCPPLQNAQIERTWSGLRPLTFDGFPMIGPLPGSKHVLVATGHFRSGIHLAFGTAELVADIVQSKTPMLDVADFRVGKQLANTA
ncbi:MULTISPECIES: glycine oxidase ThiO [Crateriforma]|uniref:glycine oxidase ThiO n=1 Tax=Crateriforma TaxID=2714592 RepID=UPI0018CE6CE6|nr:MULTISPECIES: glycine oxidase ThiO [Crateriforma]